MTKADSPQSSGRFRTTLSSSRDLVRLVYRDPEHVAERLTLYANERLSEPSRDWAREKLESGETSAAEAAEQLRTDTAKVARVDGFIAGTPFFIALVPGYMGYLWQEGRMGLRTAALYGRDPTTLDTAAEMLALRGVHPDTETAKAALIDARDNPAPEKPDERRGLMLWYRSIYAILIFGGFLSAPSEDEKPTGWRPRLKAAAGITIGTAIWALTWIAPLTLMVALSWGCETHARQLGRRTQLFYGGEATSTDEAIAAADTHEDKGHDKRQILRSIALGLSLAVPVGFVIYANHVRQETGINWVAALGALVALAIVIATTVIASRR